ncbi:uncharacterized protein LOC129774074 [Toxorhynchites rutilus septentrionalis]|uniref:uncharacterized protein LOC129774074 n=1 Tax=Toxorhynchites rutilus septentrionalis TaxID=329112 RepID=UPI00247AF022|nr:uncharacterized protein LOC129774074 [Toxorhynchites rutilus septentrionalis]
MTFGSTCSPSCAQAAKNSNADDFQERYPEAAYVITNQHYVDDCVESFDNTATAIKVINEVISIHERGGFHIRNFISNSNTLLRGLPSDRVLTSEVKLFNGKDDQTEKVLGVYWNTNTDTIGYMVNMNKLEAEVLQNLRRPTWREVMAFVLSVYDPLGLIAHITIQGKTILQEVHKTTTNWDEEIPHTRLPAWNSWLEKLKQAENISIPRYVQVDNAVHTELHVFVDASELAYSACVYIKSVGTSTKISLLTAKSRVAPIKALSIPRLELQAAVLGTRLLDTVKRELRISINRSVLWSDSQTVLSWIQSNHRDYKVFVAHRVGEILSSTTTDQWRYVPTKLNPADAATKPSSGNTNWLSGPQFLNDPEKMWPQQMTRKRTNEEIRNFILLHTNPVTHWFFRENYYSSWWRLLSHLCILNRVAEKYWFKKLGRPLPSSWITVEDRTSVENALYRKAQWDSFPDEMACLLRGRLIPQTSKLAPLMPYLDDYGVIRSRSRLVYGSELLETMRKPIILPPTHRITQLLVRDAHERYHHTAFNVVMGVLQERYHITRLRGVLNNVLKKCQQCANQRAQPQAPEMAPLPDSRITPHLPTFTHCGVDYFGPYEVAIRRKSIEKRWGVIFTCLASRAVHIEMVEKLDSDCFIRCFQDFTSRRGQVTHLYSDNGTNFVGAEKEMKIQLDKINVKLGPLEAAKLKIKWTFNPPNAPHFGGAWERLIGIIKNALKHMLTYWVNRPSPEVLRSALIRAEFILNSRPLTDIPINETEEGPLTPFHFLLGRPGESTPPYDIEPSPYTAKTYVKIQQAAKYFWDRWKNEYLPTQIKRSKWTKDVIPLKVDDIVVTALDNKITGRWLKGRVTEVFTGKDNRVRSVKINTIQGDFTRPVVKVAKLDLEPKDLDAQESTDDLALKERLRIKDRRTIPEPTAHASNTRRVSKRQQILADASVNFGKRRSLDIDRIQELARKVNVTTKKRRKTGTFIPIKPKIQKKL